MPRIPSVSDLAAVSRSEWDQICRSLAALLHQADGVEDALGKGNGLDAIRLFPEPAHGWQFRRLNDRLGYEQTVQLRKAAERAIDYCKREESVDLKHLFVWLNIDLEPGHGNKKGERQRIDELKKDLKSRLDLDLEVIGVTRVHALLVTNPGVFPSLFEDVALHLEEVKAAQKEAGLDIKSILDYLSQAHASHPALQRMIQQAHVHFERGLESHWRAEMEKALLSLDDALNLLRGLDADPVLEGRILVAKIGLHGALGDFKQAIDSASAALSVLPASATIPLLHAKGNLAQIYMVLQRFDEAASLFESTLATFESLGDIDEILRTLTHLVELGLNRGDLAEASTWAARLSMAANHHEKARGKSMLTIAAHGALARLKLGLGIQDSDQKALVQAEHLFQFIEEAAIALESMHILLPALSGRAEAVRWQDRLSDAEAIYRQAIVKVDALHMRKNSADFRYSLALVLHDSNRLPEAESTMRDAVTRYRELGDQASALDAVRTLQKWGAAL